MKLAKVLLQSAGLLPIDATEHDSPRHTRSRHPEAASSSGNSTPMLQSAADCHNIDMIDPTCDALLGLLVWLSEGFYIHPDDKAATAIEVLINTAATNVDNIIKCTCEAMERLRDVLNIMMAFQHSSISCSERTRKPFN